MSKMKRCPQCYGHKTVSVWEEVERDEISVTCEKREKICPTCDGIGEVLITNGDSYRIMSDTELANEILAFSLGYRPWCDNHCDNYGDDGCDKCIEGWIKLAAEDKRGSNFFE